MVLEEQEWASFDRQRVDRQRERIARGSFPLLHTITLFLFLCLRR